MSKQMTAGKREPVRIPALTKRILQRTCACGQHQAAGADCSGCREERQPLPQSFTARPALLQRCGDRTCPTGTCNHDEGPLRRRANGSAAVPPVVHEVLRSPGQPLDPGTRAFMEPRFGHDFSLVRVHTDARAAESSEAINSLAFTVGKRIVFS